MKIKYFLGFFFFFALEIQSQTIQVSDSNFTPQELIEDVLFPDNTDCIQNVSVNNAVSGNFSNTSSYGYFQSSGSGFSLEKGIVLTTGRLTNVPGPNDNLSDDDAPNWVGDTDLENVLGISNTTNATSITFQFTPQANNLSFRYLFASEEYRENESTTCDFSDVFGFLIRPLNGNFENIAVVPGTNTPVSVTTVRPDILNACDALNEEYFGQFNNSNAPINFNGQTEVLTANTDVVAGTTYEIKLVIADDLNFRFDSAVFIEADSFNLGVDLGQDLTGDRALCNDANTLLEVDNNLSNVDWFFNDNPIVQNVNQLDVNTTDFGSGTYRVEATLPSGCVAKDEIEIEFQQIQELSNLSLQQCDDNGDGLANFNLFSINQIVSQQNQNLTVDDYYETENDALQEVNAIDDPQNFLTTSINQQIYVSIVNDNGCTTVENVDLQVIDQELEQVNIVVCPVNETSPISYGFAETMNQVAASINETTSNISLHPTKEEAANNMNQMVSGFIEIPEDELPKTLYVRVQPDLDCAGLVPVKFFKLNPPELNSSQEDILLCENQQDGVTLDPGLEADDSVTFTWSNGATTPTITVVEPGTYTVTVEQISAIGDQNLACSSSTTFDVISSGIAIVSTEITGVPGNNQVIITADGIGDYEFALNTTDNFQDDNQFQLTQPTNTIYVRDKNGCGIVSKQVEIVQFNEFFTPNGDGYNDVWEPVKSQTTKQQIKRIYIFDRYGKLIKRLSGNNFFWDGTLNGKALPSNDYWYQAIFKSGEKVTGNITLKR